MPSATFASGKLESATAADAMLANYLHQQQKQIGKKRAATGAKLPQKPAPRSPLHLDCRNLTGASQTSNSNQSAYSFDHRFHQRAAAQDQAASLIVQIQRKLVALFYIYLVVIISLYLTYAIYCYYQQSQYQRKQQDVQPSSSAPAALAADQQQQQPAEEFQTKLEAKIHLLERYIEVLAVDLEATKGRLSEREKCSCAINCSFNGTQYADGQMWRHKCDQCRCSSGKISCAPRECPKLACSREPQAVVKLQAGQCCPTCMKKCKLNQTLVAHGHTFAPKQAAGQPAKQCKCHDGLIKCQPLIGTPTGQQRSNNKTAEYLREILGPQVLPGRV